MIAPRPLDLADALFLDLDGTLAPIEATPELVQPVERRTRLLAALGERLGGAVAVLSGRTLADVDRILAGGCAAVAGVHGLMRRSSDGRVIAAEAAAGISRARAFLEPFVHSGAGLLLEDKGHALAVHFRGAPDSGEAVRDLCARVAQVEALTVQPGDMVCELRTPGPTKGDSLRAFLEEPPFRGRDPIMVGDDLTDEHAFAAAAACAGFGVLVGPERPTAARHRLRDVEEVFRWLETSLETGLR